MTAHMATESRREFPYFSSCEFARELSVNFGVTFGTMSCELCVNVRVNVEGIVCDFLCEFLIFCESCVIFL